MPRRRSSKPKAIAKRLATEIVNELFVNGSGQRAERLVLTTQVGTLGGWGEAAAYTVIQALILKELATIGNRPDTE